MRRRRAVKLGPGTVVPARALRAASQEEVPLPHPDRLTHLQFRRFAGCPVCDLHLRSVAGRHPEITAAGIAEVVVFHSSAASLLAHEQGWPFPLIPDPDKALYREFGVEASPLSVLHPGAWGAEVRGILAKKGRLSLDMSGGPLGLPADFLIGPEGEVLAVHYGTHANDHWSVDELLALARRAPG